MSHFAVDEAHRWRRIGLVAVAFIVVALLVVVGLLTSDGEVDALRLNPLARYEPTTPGVRFDREVASDGDSIMMPGPAVLHRRYTVPPGREQELMDELAGVAESHGWDVEARELAGGYEGGYDDDGTRLRLSIGFAEDAGEVYLDLSTDG